MSAPAVGIRVQLATDVDRFPDFVAKAGSTGRVVESPVLDAVAVQLDSPPEGSEAWDGIVFWYEGIHQWQGEIVLAGVTL